jgi:hypothetical protein
MTDGSKNVDDSRVSGISTHSVVSGLTVLGEGVPVLEAAPSVDRVEVSSSDLDYLTNVRSRRNLLAAHESSHAVCAAHLALEQGLPTNHREGGWPLRSVFGVRAGSGMIKIKSIDIAGAGGYTHIRQGGEGRTYSTASDLASQIIISLSGPAFEKLHACLTSGCDADFRSATRAASTCVQANMDVIGVGTDDQPGILLPSLDGLGDRAEPLYPEYLTRLRVILDEAMSEASRIVRARDREIIALANIVVAQGGRLSGDRILAGLREIGMPLPDDLVAHHPADDGD